MLSSFSQHLTEGTCIDFSVPLQSGARVNFEIKYTESEFGSAKADQAHLEKFERTYQLSTRRTIRGILLLRNEVFRALSDREEYLASRRSGW